METSHSLLTALHACRAESLAAIDAATTIEQLAQLRRQVLGKNGVLATIRRQLATLPAAEKPTVGQQLSAAQREVEDHLAACEQHLLATQPALDQPLDVTLPAPLLARGGRHPTLALLDELNDAFTAMNFQVYEGPELSTEEMEFDALNFPPDHPARESMDTYWLTGQDGGGQRWCLRPHLTGASVRYLREHGAPARLVYPGRVYRNETTDARHERAFYQYEVLLVDRQVSLAAANMLVDVILQTVFGYPVRIRMRPGFFPFVEPGFEIDMECQVCTGTGCATCHQVGWLELMPGGSPHPNVLAAAGLDPGEWSGIYVNVGLDRLAMMRYGIPDVRLMHSGDLRFLRQFR